MQLSGAMQSGRHLSESFLDRYRLAAVIQAAEEDLRAFIRQYVSPYVEPDALVGDKIAELRKRAAGDGAVDPANDTLVDYLDFGDAFAILNRHRAMVPEGIAGAVRALTPAFEIAVPIRNRIMHGRPLLGSDEEQVARLGQSIVDSDAAFVMTRAVVARLVEDASWAPILEITTTQYGNALHNLPLPEFDETGLLGREDELRQVRELLSRRRYPVITIAGEGGIGKTALAVQALYDLVDSANPPFDAVLWASLKTERLTGHGVQQVRDAAFDLWTLTAELGSVVDTEVGSDLTLLSELLEGTRTLIAIDNVETMGAGEIRDFIDAVPDAQFLLTSRVGLGEIEWRVSLGALGPSAAKNMLRHLANRRGLPQLARMSDRQATQVVERLRGSPLAIRWFVEAVQVGGQPDALLHDQSVVLQFCMSSIYDSLSEEGQRVVDCLVALDTTASVGQIALLTDLERDQVQQQIYELQRRSIVQVDSRLSETLTQSYAVSAMPREYLRRFGSLDRGFGDQVRGRLKEIEATDEIMRRYDNVVSLEPMAIMVETAEERAVANVLRQALRRSRQGDLEGARRDVARARDAAPAFFETYRVGAFIESSPRPEEARRLYQDAYRLAPPEGRPKVAYWLAGHLLSLMAAGEAEQFAREAHDALGLPATALRLGRVCMYEGQRFDEAETLLKFAATADAAKTRLIAETTLVDLAKRRAERLAEDEKQPASAIAAAVAGIRRAEGVVASGVVDSRFEHDFAALVSEALLISLRLPDIAAVSQELAEVLEAIDRSFRVLSRADLRETWMPRLGRICSGRDCPEEIVMYGRKLETRLQRRLVLQGSGRLTGTVLEYSAKKRYGFIRTHDGEPNLFFHRTAVNDSQELILLNRGAEVSYAVREKDHQGETKTRATDVAAVLGEVERERALRRRRGRVVHRTETYLFTEDIPTQERVFVHRSALRNGREWASIRDGSLLSYDLTFSDQGPIAVAGTAALDGPDE